MAGDIESSSIFGVRIADSFGTVVSPQSHVVIGVAVASGVILLAAAQAGLPIYEYTPLQVKQAVTGYGKAVKKQVQEMTRMLLSLPAVPKPDDTADALAMAITFCHTNGNQLNRFTRRVAGPI